MSDDYPHIQAIPMKEPKSVQDGRWLEAARESFEEAVESEQWNLAADIIVDVAHAGFQKDAEKFTNDMLLAKQEDIKE